MLCNQKITDNIFLVSIIHVISIEIVISISFDNKNKVEGKVTSSLSLLQVDMMTKREKKVGHVNIVKYMS